LFKPSSVDSDSNGVPDVSEPIKQKLDDIVGKLGGDTIGKVKDDLNGAVNNPYWTGGDERLNDLPVIRINFMGLNAVVFSLNNPDLIPFMAIIRGIVLPFLIWGFAYSILSLFNLTWKV